MPATLNVVTHKSLMPLVHGFFTRKGGASSGIFQGLNCGTGSSDQSEAVTLNRERVAKWLGVAPENLARVHQIHSADVLTVTNPIDTPPKADALVTDRPGIALTVLTADCQPVLFADRVANVIGAAHAGWRGALSGVLGNTVAAMCALGAKPERIHAVIGPSISQAAYEVGPDFRDVFLAEDRGYDRFFASGDGDRLRFDLTAFGLYKLKQAGVTEAYRTGQCTYAEEENFFSYRRSTHRHEADYGRQIAAIRL